MVLVNRKTLNIYILIIFIGMVGGITKIPTAIVLAKEVINNVNGEMYGFAKDGNYEFSSATAIKSKKEESDFGNFEVQGDIKEISNVNNIPSYEVMDGNVTLAYVPSKKLLDADSKDWHLVDDKTKKINDIKLKENILKGALILQTSFDGETWITDNILTNIAADKTFTYDFYSTKDIQQVNGCFYRVIVAYKVGRQIEGKKGLLKKNNNYEYIKYAEVYEFYVINSSERLADITQSTDSPKKELGTKINTGKDNGYSGNIGITSKDPHYGWNIGKFFVNGYTRETKDDISGSPIFLKNVGDRVTLWFNLEQDIDSLNGKKNLSISEDINGSDQYFEIQKTNLKRGALIISYTDFEGVKHDPVIYTDYLLANTRTGADTKVELFEEGDYEVSLNYEIKNTSGIDSYTNYKILFAFSIRNGNCMVYPFDITLGQELSDNEVTENGFRLDMAKSRYLTIDVKRSVLVKVNGSNGRIEDIRFNRPAKDGEIYKDEGIYTFDVKNLYTGQNTLKTIYVGKDLFIKAMSRTGLTIKELEDKLSEGYEITDDGILLHLIDTEETIEESKKVQESEIIEINSELSQSSKIEDEEYIKDDTEEAISKKVISKKYKINKIYGLTGLIAIIIIGIVAAWIAINQKNKKQIPSKGFSNDEREDKK